MYTREGSASDSWCSCREAECLENAVARREAEEKAEEARLIEQANAMRAVAPAMPTPLAPPRAPEKMVAPFR